MIAITPLILTFNEAPNIARTLSRLAWAADIVVVDSYSTDQTCEIASRDPRVRLFKRPFTTLADQWNFGLEETGISTDWVLALDADYVLSDELIAELHSLDPDSATAGYRASFKYCVDGRVLRSGVYPPVTVLFLRRLTRVEQDGHAQRARVNGAVQALAGRILHDDRKPLSHWLAAQAGYMRLEARKIEAAIPGSLSTLDRFRKLIVVAPPAMFLYCYVIRGGLLDGRAGLYYALQRLAAELILSLYLIERTLGRDG